MKRETCRSIGAITGLTIGWAIMLMTPWRGILPAFVFGMIGTLSGSISAERWFDRRNVPQSTSDHGERVKHE